MISIYFLNIRNVRHWLTLVHVHGPPPGFDIPFMVRISIWNDLHESRFIRIPGLPPSAPSHQIHPQEDARVWEIPSLALPSLPGCAVARILCLI